MALFVSRQGSDDHVVGWVWGVPRFRDTPIRFCEGSRFEILRFCHYWVIKPPDKGFYYLSRVFLSLLLKPIPLLLFVYL